MGFVAAGPNTKVFVGDADLSAYFNSVSLPSEVDTVQTTGFGKAHHCYTSTLKDGTVTLAGFWDGAVDAVDEELAAALGGGARPILVGFSGGAIGDYATIANAVKTSYEVSGEVAGVVEIAAEAQCSGASGIASGLLLHGMTVETATGDSASVDNGVGTAAGGVAHLYVAAASGTSPTLSVVLQSSTDNVTFIDFATFATATGPTTDRIEFAGSAFRYMRVRHVIGGSSPSFTYAVTFARG